MCYENRLPGTIYFGGNSPIFRRAMEGERGEVFCHGNGGGLTSRQHDQGIPQPAEGGPPDPSSPTYWPLSPRSERLGVRGLANWESLMESFGKSSQFSRERHWRAQNSRESSYCLNIHSGAKKLSACLGPGQNLGHLRVFGALFNTKLKKKNWL